MTDAKSTAPRLEATSLTPNITATDLEESVRFYTEGLGFEVQEEHEHEGMVVYVVVRSGSVLIGLGRDNFEKGRERTKGVGQRIWLATEQDLEPLAARVKAAGFELETDVEDLPWGGRAFAVRDPNGFAISVASGG